MIEIKDFSKYSEAELRALLIDNAKPVAGGMARVVREITKKYNACDRDMLLWFIKQPPYNGVLWGPDHRVLTAEVALKEEKALQREMERQQKKRIEDSKKRKVTPTHTVVTPVYPMPQRRKAEKKQPGIVEQFKALGCKPVLIDTKVVGITRIGSYAKVDAVIEQAHKDNWEVIEYD